MRRKTLFAALVASSNLLWASISWSSVGEAVALPSADASENLCRADQVGAQSLLASVAPRDEELPESLPRKRDVFAAPIRGVIEKGVLEAARNLLDLPMGSEVIIEVNGTPYGFRLEPHYHPPGYQGGPIGWHKGVTVYELEERDAF
jgi:hypothetical protein